MGTFSGQDLADELEARLRDSSFTAYPQANVLQALNAAQRSINVRLGLYHGEATFTTADTALYDLETIDSNIAYVAQVFDDNKRELDFIPFANLPMNSSTWLRDKGEKPDIASQIGREILVITPIPYRAATLTVRFVQHPTQLLYDATLSDLPDEYKPLILDLAEAIALFRGRYFKAMQECLQRVLPKLGLEDAAQIIRRGRAGEALPPSR